MAVPPLNPKTPAFIFQIGKHEMRLYWESPWIDWFHLLRKNLQEDADAAALAGLVATQVPSQDSIVEAVLLRLSTIPGAPQLLRMLDSPAPVAAHEVSPFRSDTPAPINIVTLIQDTASNLANYPAAAFSQAAYIETDTQIVRRSDGVSWTQVIAPALLPFLGLTSGFPALKRSVAILQARLADDSDYTDMEAAGRAYDATTWNGSKRVVIEDAIRDYLEAAWTPWTPTYSSDVGNAAATFSGAVTTTLARYRVIGKTCFVTVSFSATLNAVTPAYLILTLPGGITPQNNDTFNPCIAYNNGTYEAGMVEAVAANSTLRVFRPNNVLFTSASSCGGLFSFTFEMA